MTQGARTVGATPRARPDLAGLLQAVHARLAAHRAELDDLNVFPVPDGDTGTNMTLTVQAALTALADVPSDAPPRDHAAALARGAMRGARGNSGIILSQVLRAVAEGPVVDGPADVDAAAWARTLRRACELAYDAIAEPVEGTMLTAIADAADAADAQAAAPVEAAWTAVLNQLRATVAATRDQLAANRQAGVVDAGARGIEVVLDAVAGAIAADGGGAPPAAAPPQATAAPHRPAAPPLDGLVPDQPPARGSEPAFEVQYALDTPTAAAVAAALRAGLQQVGDSVAVVAADDLVTVHVHTNDVGAAIEVGLDHGRPHAITVSAFAEEVARRQQRSATGCVAVLPSATLERLAARHRAVVVGGRPGALPSVADLLAGVERAHTRRVFVLPGHRHVVPAATQAATIAREHGHDVEVIAGADSVPALLAALAVWLPEASETGDALEAAAAGVVAGEVVAAVRDADTPLGPVTRGHYLAVAGGAVVAADPDPLGALDRLLDTLPAGPCEVVTLVAAEPVTADEHDAAVDRIRARRPGADVEVIDGGALTCRYLVGIE